MPQAKTPPRAPPLALTTFSEMHVPVKHGQANILLETPLFPLIPEREQIAIHGLASAFRENDSIRKKHRSKATPSKKPEGYATSNTEDMGHPRRDSGELGSC